MKKTISLLFVIILLFSGCEKENHKKVNNKDNIIQQEDAYTITADEKENETRITISQRNDYPQKEGVTVKKHKISRLLNGYAYWYSNTNAEKILNIINQRDREALKNSISKSSQAESDIEKQMDILFEYIDGDFIDYEEGLPGEDNYISYGEYLQQSFSVVVLAKTEKSEYNVCINFVLKDYENEDNIGVEYIVVTNKEVMDYYFENYDSQSQPKYPDEGGIWCMDKNGVIR